MSESTRPEAVIVAGVRTPIGTSFKGTLRHTTAMELAQVVVTEARARSGLDVADIDDVILAESNYGGGDLARHAAVAAGMHQVPGQAVNRHCAGGLTAIGNAAAAGTKMVLLSRTARERAEVLARRIRHVSLATHPDFERVFMEALLFPSQ